MNKLFTVTLLVALLSNSAFAHVHTDNVNQIHKEVVTEKTGIGAREAGTPEEITTAKYIISSFEKMGLTVSKQSFTFGKNKRSSMNIIANTQPALTHTIVLGAHYDSTGAEHGSLGATDNGAGLAAMLAIASKLSKTKNLNYNIRFIAFGAEEVGLFGSKHYMKVLSENVSDVNNIKAMINFDTIAGGDFTYVHSAHTTPYQCPKAQNNYNSSTVVRDALLAASKQLKGASKPYVIHPAYEGYPEGVTGSWSDHAPFACAGVPIAYVESTNFTINGKDGYDGYSQSVHPTLWDCFDEKNKTACDRKTETKWGKIWHTEFDRLDKLDILFPGRLDQQMTDNVNILTDLLSNFDKYAK